MDYCAIQALLETSGGSRNVFNTLFHCHEIDNYLEKHRIFEILGELMVRVCIDRPENVAEYLSLKLTEISRGNGVKVELHSSQIGKTVTKLSTAIKLPIMGNVNDTIDLERSRSTLEDALNRNSSRKVVLSFEANDESSNFLRILRTSEKDEKDEKESQICRSRPSDAIDIQLVDEFFSRHRLNGFLNFIRNPPAQDLIKAKWSQRVMIVGRMGAGRKTQAALLAMEFGLRFIDSDYLMLRYRQHGCLSKKHRLGFWGFLQETLLKPDCLHSGYVIVCNVISNRDLEILMEKFIFGPNRIIFLHTSERECRRRSLAKVSQLPATHSDRNAVFHYHMNLYDLNKKAFAEYFTRNPNGKIFHVDGGRPVSEIKALVGANLNRA